MEELTNSSSMLVLCPTSFEIAQKTGNIDCGDTAEMGFSVYTSTINKYDIKNSVTRGKSGEFEKLLGGLPEVAEHAHLVHQSLKRFKPDTFKFYPLKLVSQSSFSDNSLVHIQSNYKVNFFYS
jgi:hypothetical protein